MLHVSPSTVRRDLAQLTTEGRVARTYGGAMVTGHAPEAPLYERSVLSAEEKDGIAAKALDFIHDGDTILVDAGSTMTRLCHYLSTARSQLHVITCGLSPAREFAGVESSNTVTLLGGDYRKLSDSLVGPAAERMLQQITADSVFLGADALTAEYGICEADSRQTSLKELMCERARDVYVLADATKLGEYPFHNWARLNPPWTLITDHRASAGQLRPFEDSRDVTVIVTKSVEGEAPRL